MRIHTATSTIDRVSLSDLALKAMDPLSRLQKAVADKRTPRLLLDDGRPTDDISLATSVILDDKGALSLSQPTRYVKDSTASDLKTVLFALLHRDLPSADYIQACSAKGITHFTFVEKNELLSFLSGNATESAHITPLESSKRPADAPPDGDQKRGRSDIVLKIYAQEHVRKPFSHCLHGQKEVDFSNVQREARDFFLASKNSRPAPAVTATKEKTKSRLRDPIILLSPSASSLITMHNVKRFLEEGVFVPPEVAARETGGPAPELLSLAYKSKFQTGKTLRFVVVENTDKFKPDYWDRLLVVFTTGQAWQFKPYAQSFSDPRSLFHRTKGVLVRYRDEPTNQAERDWNIQGIQIDRQSRYNDRVTVGLFWDSVERWIEEKGKKDFYRHERR